MSDSKGAAIEKILDKFKEETEDLWEQFMEGDSPAPQKYDDFLDNAYQHAKQAILAILAQEVKRANEQGVADGIESCINSGHIFKVAEKPPQ